MKGDVLGSLVEFDKAIELDPRQKACEFLDFFSTLICFIKFKDVLNTFNVHILDLYFFSNE